MLVAVERSPAPRRRAPSRARSASRVHAALTALAFVLANLLGVIHEATTTHVRCAQHGELIDSDPAAANAVRTATPASSAVTGDPVGAPRVGDLTADALHGHEHCSLISATRESRMVPRSPALAPARVTAGDLVVSAPRTSAPRGRLIYRTAPKTSPPASRSYA